MKKCPHPHCLEMIAENAAMCPTHWRMVPALTVDAIFALNEAAHGCASSAEARREQERLIQEAADLLAAVQH